MAMNKHTTMQSQGSEVATAKTAKQEGKHQ